MSYYKFLASSSDGTRPKSNNYVLAMVLWHGRSLGVSWVVAWIASRRCSLSCTVVLLWRNADSLPVLRHTPCDCKVACWDFEIAKWTAS